MKFKVNNKLIKSFKKISHYFAIFDYFPSFEDVYTFFPLKISKKRLKNLYEAKKNTVGEYSKLRLNRQKKRKNISINKLKSWRFRAYLKLISLFPQIKLIGLSGSISMLNANVNDDIDLFIITSKNRLFIARFIALFLAQLLGLRRKRGKKEAKNKVCLNLFFDERNLTIPKLKQTLFVGHEVLQMKPIVNKNNIYNQLIKANKWVFKLFPNAEVILKEKGYLNNKIKKQNKLCLITNFLSYIIELILKYYQLKLIDSHKTKEMITPTQLWFHPDDFEKKIKNKIFT